jgi:CheY-like chemotaxis protein
LRRILVVDDQENWRQALIELLSGEGYIVESLGCFDEAARVIAAGEFDLAVLDIRLEDEDVFNVQGLELLRLAKNQEKVPKVVVLTGYPDSLRPGILEEFGADALILKVPPSSKFDTERFKEQIKDLLPR